MRGKKLLEQVFALNPVQRIPWVPFVGVHAAQLIGVDSESYLKSKDLIVRGVNAALDQYNPDGIPIVFDLQLEAEALGCGLVWAAENPPSVNTHPLAEGSELTLESMVVPLCSGRIATVMEATREIRAQHPDLALYGLITGPFTLALHLLGTDIFMKMFMESDYIHRTMRFCTSVCQAMTSYYKEAGCDVIAVVDPMTSQIGPDQFVEFVQPYCTEVFDYIKSQDLYSSFFVCGHAQHNIEVMCDCRPDNISIDENIPLDYVRDVCLERGISFGGNLMLTVTLLMGTPSECEKDAVNCIDIGGSKGYILAPGCDLAYATPVENLTAVSRLIDDPYRRDVIRAMEVKGLEIEPLDLVEYTKGEKIKIDVVTLDSASCAPCQYMFAAVTKAVEQIGYDKVELREHKVKLREGVEMMVKLGVKNIPTICIDGQVCFISNIPPVSQIKQAIEDRMAQRIIL